MWDDGLIGRQELVARVVATADGDVVELTSFTPGPAGIDQLRSSTGVTVTFDHARPDRVHQITIARDADPSAVATLVGYSMAEQIREFRASGSRRAVRLRPDRDAEITTAPRRGRDPKVDTRLGEAAAMASVALHDAELPLVRVTAAVALSARLTTDTSLHRVVPPTMAERIMAYTVDIIDGCDEDEWKRSLARLRRRNTRAYDWLTGDNAASIANFAGRDALRVLEMLRIGSDAADADDDGEAPMGQVASAPDIGWDDRDDWGDDAPRVAMARFAAPRHTYSDVAMQVIMRDPIEPYMRIRVTSPGRIVVSGPGVPADGWIRVLDDDDQELLALVPTRARGDAYVAEAIVPADRDADDMVAEVARVTDAPVGSIELITRAVDLGRDAVSLEVLGRDAASAWRACANAWNAAGDASRSKRALAHSRGKERVTRTRSIVDDVRDAIGP
jgi:hypothetical protein